MHKGEGERDDIRPVPDPTALTTAALAREIAALKEIIYTRLDGMDRAFVIYQENLTRQPTEIDRQISQLKELHNEKFCAVETQFRERDDRAAQVARESKNAVDAALAAQEKSASKQNEAFALTINKAEGSLTKLIDQQGQLISQNAKAVDDKISDIKERLTRIEGQNRGEKEAVQTKQSSNLGVVSVVSLIIGSVIGIGGLLAAVFAR